MSIVPSDAYMDGDPGGERADTVLSGFIAAVMMFVLASGFAVVAFFAFQQMRGIVVIADAGPSSTSAGNNATDSDDAARPDVAAAQVAPPPQSNEYAGDASAGSDTAAAQPDILNPAPSIKPARTKPPTVTFDSSIIEDTEPSPSAVDTAEVDTPEVEAANQPAIDDPAPFDGEGRGEPEPVLQAAAEPPSDDTMVAQAPAVDIPPANPEPATAAPTQQGSAPPDASSPAAPVIAPPDDVAVLTPPAADIPAAIPETVDALSGTHVVQVGSFRSEEEALADWRRLTRRYETLITGKDRHVEPADLGERGVFYRLRIGPFDSVEAARSHCQALKDGGQDCLTVRH